MLLIKINAQLIDMSQHNYEKYSQKILRAQSTSEMVSCCEEIINSDEKDLSKLDKMSLMQVVADSINASEHAEECLEILVNQISLSKFFRESSYQKIKKFAKSLDANTKLQNKYLANIITTLQIRNSQLHKAIIEIGMANQNFTENEGVCTGATMAWMEAAFLGEIELFDTREDLFVTEQDLMLKVQIAQNKLLQKQPLTKEDELYLSVPVLLEKINAFQSPEKLAELSATNLTQDDFEKISKYVSSENILKKGGLQKITSTQCNFSATELLQYIKNIKQEIEKLKPTPTEPIGILVQSFTHTTGLTYNPKTNRWLYKDINIGQTLEVTDDDLATISDKIIDGMKNHADDHQHTISFTYLSTSEQIQQYDLITKLKDKLKIRQSPEELQGRQNLEDYLLFLSQTGQHEKIDELATAGVSLQFKTARLTIASTAIIYGNLKVLKVLKKHGYDFTDPSIYEEKSLLHAIVQNNTAIIQFLIQSGCDPRRKDSDGNSALSWAIKYNNHQALSTIITECENISQPISQQDALGYAILAIKFGSIESLQKINDYFPGIIFANHGGNSLMHMATFFNQDEIIDYLSNSGVDIKQLNTNGLAPIHIAARLGHINSINKLRNLGVSLNSPDSDNKTPFLHAAHKAETATMVFLYDNGAEIFSHDKNLFDADHYAAESKAPETKQFLTSIDDSAFNIAIQPILAGKIDLFDTMADKFETSLIRQLENKKNR